MDIWYPGPVLVRCNTPVGMGHRINHIVKNHGIPGTVCVICANDILALADIPTWSTSDSSTRNILHVPACSTVKYMRCYGGQVILSIFIYVAPRASYGVHLVSLLTKSTGRYREYKIIHYRKCTSYRLPYKNVCLPMVCVCEITAANVITVTPSWTYGVTNHRRLDCLLNRLFRHRSKKTSELRVTGLCRGIHRWPADSPHKAASKRPVKRTFFSFDDVTMYYLYRRFLILGPISLINFPLLFKFDGNFILLSSKL